jgi:hypothetical protein
MGRLDNQLTELRADMVAAIAAGVRQGLESCLADDELARRFWRRGFEELRSHTENHTSKWLGGHLLRTAAAAIAMALIVWLVKSGYIK